MAWRLPLLLLLSACTARDLAPDEFSLGVSRGLEDWQETTHPIGDPRNGTADLGLWVVTAGFTWRLSEAESNRLLAREIARAFQQPVYGPEEVPPGAAHEDEPDAGHGLEKLLAGLGTLLATLSAWIFRDQIAGLFKKKGGDVE
jgi:hypothetical protein